MRFSLIREVCPRFPVHGARGRIVSRKARRPLAFPVPMTGITSSGLSLYPFRRYGGRFKAAGTDSSSCFSRPCGAVLRAYRSRRGNINGQRLQQQALVVISR